MRAIQATEKTIAAELARRGLTRYPLVPPKPTAGVSPGWDLARRPPSWYLSTLTRGVSAGLIHSNLFGKAATVREALGVGTSGEALRKLLAGRDKVGVDAFVTGQAMSLALINKLRTPGDEKADLRSTAYNLVALRRLQDRYIAQGDTKMAAKIGADIKSLEAAVNRTTAAVKLAALKSAMTKITNVFQGSFPSPPPTPKNAGGPPDERTPTINVTVKTGGPTARTVESATTTWRRSGNGKTVRVS